MKKLLLPFLIFTLAGTTADAHGYGQPRTVFHVCVVPPVSTNGHDAARYTNVVSFNLLGGVSLNEQAFTLAGLANVILNDAQGFQLAGLGNYTGKRVRGAQIAGLGNFAGARVKGVMLAGLGNFGGRDVRGVTVAGLGNYANRDMRGVQVAGMANLSLGGVEGVQLAGLSNYADRSFLGVGMAGAANLVSRNMRGVQIAGAANVVQRDARGVQLAGAANITGRAAEGVQMAGAVNVADERIKGFQLSGATNAALKVKGMQATGVVNIAGNIKGMQMAGVLNVARDVAGVQLAGLLNIARSSDYPIGLINLIARGEQGIAVTHNETGSALVTFRSGGRVTYGIVGVGYNYQTRRNSLATTAGLGAHINCTRWLRINNEVKAEFIGNFSDNTAVKISYALMPAFRPIRQFEIFGGPTLNFMQTGDLGNLALFPEQWFWKDCGGRKLRQAYIGYEIGVQFFF